MAFQFNPAVVGAHNPLDDHQAQAAAFFLGRIKRLEDAVELLLRNAAAGVGHAHPDAVAVLAGLQSQRAARRHGLRRVFHQVHQHLLQLRRVNRRGGQRPLQPGLDNDAAIFNLRPEQFQGFFHDLIERNHLQLQGRGPDGAEELRDDVVQAVDLPFRHVQILLQFFADFGGVRGGGKIFGARTDHQFFRRRAAPQFFRLALHELQVDVQRVQRIADLMRDAGGQERQRLHPFAFDGLKGFFPRLGRIVQDQRHAGTARGLAIQRRGIQPQKTRPRIKHFKFMADDLRAAGVVGAGNFQPVHLRQKLMDVLLLFAGLQTDEPRDRLVEIKHAALLVHHQHAILNGVEQGFEKTPLPGNPLDDRLQSFRVQPPDAAKHFVEKTGFNRSH